nr:helix-turn-helix domain-containing protein [Lachnospiraceae bacterium]
EENYKMMKEDIILINPGTNYEIVEGEDALYGIASFSMGFTSSILKNRRMIFYCNSVMDTKHSYRDLRDIFFELTAEYTSCSHQTNALNESLMLKLLDCIVENYQVSQDDIKSEESESDLRMREMMQYIISNLDREISLNDLADQLYVSASTLSRIFKKNTGVYFADYVMQLRVRSSLSLLKHTEQSITQIALSSGFASSASYNRAFRKLYGQTPTDYRKNNQSETKREEDEFIESEKEIRKELLEKGYEKGKQDKISLGVVDLEKNSGEKYEKSWGKIINIGAIHDMTKANMQYHVMFLSEQLHYKYFRVWNVFSKKMLLFDGRSIGIYNYDLMDQVFDFFVQHKLKLFLDFGRRPETAISSGQKAVYFSEEYIEFESKEAWEALVADFLSHIVGRYGQEEVSGWIFELSRFGGHEMRHKNGGLYIDDDYDFYDAFKYFNDAIRTRVPNAQFGGVGSILNIDGSFLEEFFSKVKKDNLRFDFLSFSLFPYDNTIEEEKKRIRRISESDVYEEHQVYEIAEFVKNFGYEEYKIYITEWNNSISNRNFLNDSCFRAAYIAKKLSGIAGLVDSISIMSGSDWISSYMDTVGIVNGGIGLITKDTIRKPAYYALDFMNQLGEYVIAKDKNYIVTRKENGDFYILCFNFSWFRKNYLMQDEDLDIRQSDAMIFDNDEPITLRLQLKNVAKAGNYCIKKRTLNSQYGSILNEWKKFQYNTRLTRQDVKYLDAISLPNLSQSEFTVEKDGGTIELEIKMEMHEVDLIHVFLQN